LEMVIKKELVGGGCGEGGGEGDGARARARVARTRGAREHAPRRRRRVFAPVMD
jgi:hypothetical protein